jgi:hypothetical protein
MESVTIRFSHTQASVYEVKINKLRFYKRINRRHTSAGHAVAQWLRHCATNRKVAGSISDGLIGIFHRRNPSGRTMALGSTQFLTEMSTRNISWG